MPVRWPYRNFGSGIADLAGGDAPASRLPTSTINEGSHPATQSLILIAGFRRSVGISLAEDLDVCVSPGQKGMSTDHCGRDASVLRANPAKTHTIATISKVHGGGMNSVSRKSSKEVALVDGRILTPSSILACMYCLCVTYRPLLSADAYASWNLQRTVDSYVPGHRSLE